MKDKEIAKKRRMLVLCFAAIAGISYVMDNVVIARSASVYPTVFWPSSTKIERGDYVTFDFQHELIKGGRPYKLTKRVACLPGEELKLVGDHHYCNGKRLGKVLKFGTTGTPLTAFEYAGKIPDGMVFVEAEHPNSFDSRYWGFIAKEGLKRMTPIL